MFTFDGSRLRIPRGRMQADQEKKCQDKNIGNTKTQIMDDDSDTIHINHSKASGNIIRHTGIIQLIENRSTKFNRKNAFLEIKEKVLGEIRC